ncbi:hypothetical protein [Streptococcus porci]|uniref:hypothetical protein n=1 Tax=Streptococcus porci TaxID=502567 RepID=UPI00041DE57D|nr:hypothetical protein [Streptococcus porci]
MVNKIQPSYTVTVYSQIDRSVRDTHYFETEIEARVARVLLADKWRDELCDVEIEVVYE